MLTEVSFEVLWHYQSSKYLNTLPLTTQRVRQETPGWRLLDFSGNPMPDEQFERQRARIMRAPLVQRDRE